MIRRFFLLVFTLVTVSALVSFKYPKNIQKKVAKEIRTTFNTEEFHLEALKINRGQSELLLSKITIENFFKISSKNQFLGYAYVNKAPSKTAQFDYLILLDKDLIIAKTKILTYREDYGGEISSKRWLRQFNGLTSSNTLLYGKDVMAISGATISAHSMTRAVNNFLKSIEILHINKII